MQYKTEISMLEQSGFSGKNKCSTHDKCVKTQNQSNQNDEFLCSLPIFYCLAENYIGALFYLSSLKLSRVYY